LPHLVADCPDHCGIGVSHIHDAMSTNAVYVLPAINIPNHCTFASDKYQGLFGVKAAAIAILEGKDLIFGER
jgi:hypothetical protein